MYLVLQDQRVNEVFIDVIERLMVSIAADVSSVTAGHFSETGTELVVNVFTFVVISSLDSCGSVVKIM